MTGKRDAAYYKARLRRDRPTFFADLISGKYASVREAAAAAGLIRLPTRLGALKREWIKASKSQQDEFKEWLKAGALKRVGKPIADSDGRLRFDVRAFLSHWLATRRLKPGRIMEQMGWSWHDWRLAATINRGEALAPEVIPKLIGWLAKEGFR